MIGMRLMVRSVVVLLAAFGLVASSCSSDSGGSGQKGAKGDQVQLGGVVRTPPLDVATVAMPMVGSLEPMTFKADEGELLVVYFGYTSCPDICPSTLVDIRVGLRELPDEMQKRVKVALVTVDPDRDSAVVMKGYLSTFFDEMPQIRTAALRSDDPGELQTVADAFGVQFEVEEHALGAKQYEVAHTAVTFVVDDRGQVVVEWPFGFTGVDMGADLKALLTNKESQ
ncbi:MAG: SCO family protein [Microthrixaceae bacterium]|nr:SCO family protein [Microthrixaceae bacterium]